MEAFQKRPCGQLDIGLLDGRSGGQASSVQVFAVTQRGDEERHEAWLDQDAVLFGDKGGQALRRGVGQGAEGGLNQFEFVHVRSLRSRECPTESVA